MTYKVYIYIYIYCVNRILCTIVFQYNKKVPFERDELWKSRSSSYDQ